MIKGSPMAALFLVERKALKCEDCALQVKMVHESEDGGEDETTVGCFFNCDYPNCPCREVSIDFMQKIEASLASLSISPSSQSEEEKISS